MPMIDVYAAAGTFTEKHGLAQDLANAAMRWEKVPPINLFRNNTAAFIHELPAESISNAAGREQLCAGTSAHSSWRVRSRKATRGGEELTDIVVAAANHPTLSNRTWILITESPEGGWGINGHANTSADIAAAARAELLKRGH